MTEQAAVKPSSPPARAYPSDIGTLTALRFFLAIAVVAFHYRFETAFALDAISPAFEKGRLGVDIFFLLSGFVLTHVYLRDPDKKLDYPRFMIARAARIFPLHLFALSLVVGLAIGAVLLGVPVDQERYPLWGLILSVFLIQTWFPVGYFGEWNGPAWSLSAEWFAYTAFPVYAWFTVKLKDRPLVLLGAGLLVFALCDQIAIAVLGDVVPKHDDGFSVLRIIGTFLIGCALYQIGRKLSLTFREATLATLVFGFVVLSLAHNAADDRYIVLAAAPFVLALSKMARPDAEHTRGPVGRVLQFGGEASFAVYLLHLPMLMIWKNVGEQVFGRPENAVFSLLEIAGLLAVTLIVSALAYLWLEIPARRLGRQWGEAWLARRADRARAASTRA